MQFTYYVYDIASGNMVTKNINKIFAIGELFNLTIVNDDSFLWANASYIEGASIDDEQFGNIPVTLQRINLAANVPLNINIPVTFSSLNWDYAGNKVSFNASIPNILFLFRNISVTLYYNNENGAHSFKTIYINYQDDNTNSINISLDWNNENRYLAGSKIGAYHFIIETLHIGTDYNWQDFSIEQTQEPKPNINYITINSLNFVEDNDYTINVSSPQNFSNRNVTFEIRTYNFITLQYNNRQFTQNISCSGTATWDLTLANNEYIIDGSYILMASNDDGGSNFPLEISQVNYTKTTVPKITLFVNEYFASMIDEEETEIELYFNVLFRNSVANEEVDLYYTYQYSNGTPIWAESLVGTELAGESGSNRIFGTFYPYNDGSVAASRLAVRIVRQDVEMNNVIFDLLAYNAVLVNNV
jgi:hypothetical protein